MQDVRLEDLRRSAQGFSTQTDLMRLKRAENDTKIEKYRSELKKAKSEILPGTITGAVTDLSAIFDIYDIPLRDRYMATKTRERLTICDHKTDGTPIDINISHEPMSADQNKRTVTCLYLRSNPDTVKDIWHKFVRLTIKDARQRLPKSNFFDEADSESDELVWIEVNSIFNPVERTVGDIDQRKFANLNDTLGVLAAETVRAEVSSSSLIIPSGQEQEFAYTKVGRALSIYTKFVELFLKNNPTLNQG